MPMSEMEYFDMQEEQAIGEVIAACAKAIFEAHEASTMAELQRTIYKYVACGPAVSFELHEGAGGYEEDSTEAYLGDGYPTPKSPYVYVGDERAQKITEPWKSIRAIGVSSIVEGTDAEVPLEWIDLAKYCDEDKYEGDLADIAKIAVKDFDALVDEVDKEARSIWNDTHGCETCAAHWLKECGTETPLDGATPVWDECPECKGQGTVI